MATVTFKGKPLSTIGEVPAPGSRAPDFALVKSDLSTLLLADLAGKTVVLNIFPSIDTPVCASSVRRFNQEAATRPGVVVLCISRDLPFALSRFCAAEGLDRVTTCSDFHHSAFGKAYGVTLSSGPVADLFARAVLVIGPDRTVRHAQLVGEITNEPDYAAALAVL